MNPFLFRRLRVWLMLAGFYLGLAKRSAESRIPAWEVPFCQPRLVELLREQLREAARRAVEFARAAWLLLAADALRAIA